MATHPLTLSSPNFRDSIPEILVRLSHERDRRRRRRDARTYTNNGQKQRASHLSEPHGFSFLQALRVLTTTSTTTEYQCWRTFEDTRAWHGRTI